MAMNPSLRREPAAPDPASESETAQARLAACG
jgi:hypothetical protein